MQFEDLTNYDITLIKSMASQMIVDTSTSCRYRAITCTVLGCIYAKGFNLSSGTEPAVLKTIISEVQIKEHLNPKKPALEVIQDVFKALNTLKISIIRDETREVTWSSPRDSWYIKTNNHKKPWVM